MTTPVEEIDEPTYHVGQPTRNDFVRHSSDEGTYINDGSAEGGRNTLNVDTSHMEPSMRYEPSPSLVRAQAMQLDDDLALLEAERVVSISEEKSEKTTSLHRSRSRRSEPLDEFDVATNPLHETAAIYKPPEHPNTSLAKIVKKIHSSSFLLRYITYISPIVLILLVPLLLGALKYRETSVGGVELVWFSIWLEIVWLTLWAGRIVAKCIPVPLGIIMSLFTNNSKKWRDLGRQLELPATLFFWWLGVEISFLPTMKNHHVDGNIATRDWEVTVNKIIVSVFVGTILNLIEKVIIQLIAISFHTRTYADRIEINKFQIGSLVKLYAYSREKISMKDEEFEEHDRSGRNSGVKTPLHYASAASKVAKRTLNKVGDVAGAVAGDFTGRKINKSSHPHQVVLTLLNTTSGSQVLARRLYRTFVRDDFETVFSGDLKPAFDNNEEADAAFTMFDKDMNGDISMEELEAVCVEIGRERKSITASLKDLDSVVSKLDDVLFFIVLVITLLVFLSLISTSAAGVLTSAGSTILALSWLFSATAQEFLQSVIFVFVKHPFDVGDRVTVYGNTGDTMTGDDYFVKEISLLYTEFKKMQGHVVQAPNSYLNTLFILNQRRSGGLAEAVPIVIKFGTTLEQIELLRQRLLEFVRTEKREYQANILTELRTVTEAYSITLNVVFFYKSNWQNEGLRLQRRNKFICMLMVTMQEIGIEGPRKNIQGSHIDFPFHVSYHGFPPSYSAATTDNDNNNHHPYLSVIAPSTIPEERTNLPENSAISTGTGSGSGVGLRPQHSILRKGSAMAAARARGESLSRPNRHVDFSLGMSDISSGDIMGDVFEDRNRSQSQSQSQFREVVRSANQESAERRRREQEESRASSTASPRVRGGLTTDGRSSLDSRNSATGRTSFSSSIHQNRFFGRLGSQRRAARRSSSSEKQDEDLMEQGRYEHSPGTVEMQQQQQQQHHDRMDPRSGSVSQTAIHDDDDDDDDDDDKVSRP